MRRLHKSGGYGLSIREGVLVREGKPYRGIGANYFSLFLRLLKNPADTSFRAGLRGLARAGIPFVRFACCGFWPADWDLYPKDREAWFRLLGRVIREAEASGIGLIPSLFWHYATIPDLSGEPMDQLGNPKSRTLTFIRRYTREVVTRFRSSPAIWGWEMGNEYNLAADLPNASSHRPPVWLALKTAARRTERDELSSTAMRTAFLEFARTVREHDARRILLSGNSLPRPSAWHNAKERSWKADTPRQFGEVLLRDNPDPMNVISVHVYPREDSGYPAGANGLAPLIASVQGIAARAKKPLFVGEFGAPAKLGRARSEAALRECLDAIVAGGVPLAAFWVFDHPGQEGEWNVSFENGRAFMIDLVAAANRRMQSPIP